ncbi:E3 ubiquitin-protein ligase E3D isoform X2 [Rissa tridactyla]|uniref:E3 ubiquitin-protein ligase E3D isoform X2 n=1 Tax=Rissa tridactyla TaxID=75485 RepID=UPI0023BA4261|nr:E3 ubiquitin-protein ligase E3D isoform X2 [Rissa tridactyla]
MAGGFLLEIRRGTQSALLVIREADPTSSALDVSVAADCLAVRSGGRSVAAAALPAEVRLAPSSTRGLRRLPGDGLHLRMPLRRPAPPPADLAHTLRESLKPQKSYVFYCQSCGDIIVKDRKFLRVLPLPSENWSALVEEWCCHPNPFARSTLHPRQDDCFLGDTFFLLNSENESHVPESPMCCSETGHYASQSGSNLKSKENTRVICKRCRTMLGETVSADTVKYYVTEVIIRPSEESFSPTPRSQFVQRMVAQCLVELSSAKSTFRFAVKGDDGKIYILIWLLNSDTLLVESLGSSSSHSIFTLFGDIFMPNSGPVGTWSAVKVLYQPCIKSRNKDLADAWEDDIGVHPLKFPSETCMELLLILGLSTISLPPSLRCMNSFQHSEQKMSCILNSYDDIWGCSAHSLSLLLLWETKHFTSRIKTLFVRPQTVTRVFRVK